MQQAKKQNKKAEVNSAGGGVNKNHLLILLAVPFLLYAQTLAFGFVYHDDDTMIITGGKVLANFNLHQLFFTDAWLRVKEIELYRPWQSLTYAIDYAIAGPQPWIYHLHNLLGFCLCVQLFYLFLIRLKIPPQHALWLGIFYAVHFLLAAAVSWIPARGDIYQAIFGLAGLICWMNYTDHQRPLQLGFTVVLYLLALLSKESAAVLPVLFVLLYFLYKKPGEGVNISLPVVAMIPMALVLGFYLYMRSSVLAQQHLISFNALVYNLPVLPEEFFKFFVPGCFAVLPAFNPMVTAGGIALMFVTGIAVFILRKKTDERLLVTGVCIFLLPLLAVLFYKPVFAGFAYDYLDHRMLLPSTGLLLVVYALVLPSARKFSSKYVLPGLAVVMAVAAVFNAGNYKSKYTYYDNAVKCSPGSGLAWLNYGTLLNTDGRYDEAADKFVHLVALIPDNATFRVDLAETYLAKKDTQAMLREYRALIKKIPGYTDAYYRIAGYYNMKNLTDSAIGILTAAISADPTNARNYFERGKSYYLKANMIPQAVSDFKRSIELDPGKQGPYFELGSIYVSQGDYNAAYLNYDKYVHLNPSDGVGIFYRGQALCAMGRSDEGCKDLGTAAAMGIDQARNMQARLCK